MQKGVRVVLLLLFLCTLFGIISTLYTSLALWDSVLSSPSAISNSVMAPKMRYSKMKRLLQQDPNLNYDDQERLQETASDEIFVATIAKTEGSGLENAYTSECINANVFHHQNKRLRNHGQNLIATLNESLYSNSNPDISGTGTAQQLGESSSSELLQTPEIRGESSVSFGQAIYQRSRQGFVVTYQDSGDNIHVCQYCNASFWSGEAIKQSSSNASLIYTNCCKKGQIKLEQSKPTVHRGEEKTDLPLLFW